MVQKKYQNPKGGLNKAGRAYFKRTTGANLKPPVSAKKAKKSPKAAARRKSFCARMQGMNDPNSRINKALRKWDC